MFDGDNDASGAATSPLIYLVDDDDDFREEMVFGLSQLGVDVQGFSSAAALYRACAARPPDILVLDVVLKEEDGLSVATHLKASQSIGIIMVSARTSIDDRIRGLEAGADAYLPKPVNVRELAARIVALHRRVRRSREHITASAPSAPRWTIEEGGWVLADGMGHRLRLTTSEQRFLGRLFKERGKIVDRRAIVEAMGADIYDFNYAHLDTIASRLRRRAAKANMTIPLHAIRGEGFYFAKTP